MANQCPLCGQPLPKGVHQHELNARLKKLTSPALAAERKKIKEEYDAQLVAEREFATRKAEERVGRELREAKARAKRAEQEKQEGLRKMQTQYEERLEQERRSARLAAERGVRKEFEGRLNKEVAKAVRDSTKKNERNFQKLKADREKERIRHEAERAKLQNRLDDLSRKLDRQSGEELGTEAELDLLTELQRAFPQDKIDPIGRGIRGADVVQQVMDGTKLAGRIIYESKNTLDWNHNFISQARRYQTQYETPHVVIVTRAFPAKQKGMCVMKGIPVVEKRAAIALATLIREGVVEIAKLRPSSSLRDEKSQELFAYIVGDKFGTRFREIAESVTSLRSQQQKERTWHENAWQTETKIHERIEGCHREVGAQIRAIVRGASESNELKLAARA